MKYYWIVTKRAFKDTMQFFGYSRRNKFIGLVGFIITLIIAFRYFGVSVTVETWIIPAVISVCVIPLFFSGVFLFKLLQVPAYIFEELGGFNELRLVVKPEPTDGGYVTFILYNKSVKTIQETYAVLDWVKREGSDYKTDEPIILKWSSENPPINGRHELIAGSSQRIDVAQADSEHNMMGFLIQNQSTLRFPVSVGVFHAQITIHSTYNSLKFESQFVLDFEYEGRLKFTSPQTGQQIPLKSTI
ncbi:MAG: hypothetical protein J0L63_10515 [Anaerolineae bacterium]|nr:hypothetical protein [Anaerolineae bacterium]